MAIVSIATFLSFILLYVAYGVGLVFYRLYFSPLSKFPGPKLAAAATLWYEFYHDVIRRGRYTFEIAKMHEIYGRFEFNVVR